MSTQDFKIVQCSRNQHKMKPISPSFAPYLSRVPQHTVQVAWLSWGIDRVSLRHPFQSIWILISVQKLEESFMPPISSQDESWFPVFDWRFEPTFHQHLKWSFPSAIGMWEGPCVSCPKWNGLRETLTQKEVGFPCSVLNSGSCYISQDEGMSESPVETLEKAIVFCLIWLGGITSL